MNRLAALKAEKDIYEVLEGDFVVKAIWTFTHRNFICFVTEYMIGGDLNTLLEDLGRLDEDQARFYFGQMILSVQSLHDLGIIHRDLKPENMLIDKSGHLRLTDFGLSKRGLHRLRQNTTPVDRKSPGQRGAVINLLPKVPSFHKLPLDGESGNPKVFGPMHTTNEVFDYLEQNTGHKLQAKRKSMGPKASLTIHKKSNYKVGTPDYMAPEVLNPENYDITHLNEKCIDWWSMGVILYQFLVGIPPFCGESISEVFDNIANLRMEWPEIGMRG